MAAESRVGGNERTGAVKEAFPRQLGPRVAYISDTHVKFSEHPVDIEVVSPDATKPTHKPFSGKDFIRDCDSLIAGGQVDVFVCAGDILDKKATSGAIDDVEIALRKLAAAGITVIFTIGNNEQILMDNNGGKLFSEDIEGVHVMHDGLVFRDYCEEVDGNLVKRRAAFVVASRVLPTKRHKEIWSQEEKLWGQKAEEQRQELVTSGRFDLFPANLDAAAANGADVIVVIHHGTEEPTLYQDYLDHQEEVDLEQLAVSAKYTHATIEFAEQHEDIPVYVVFGHVERGPREYMINSTARKIPARNACHIVTHEIATLHDGVQADVAA